MTLDKPLFEQLIESDRKLELDYDFASTGAPEGAGRVRRVVAEHLEGYAAHNRLPTEMILTSYAATVKRYANDIRAFIRTGRYPLDIDPAQAPLSRVDYDLFLILTILTTKHRCMIMEELMRFPAKGDALAIGVGSGIELSFIGLAAGGHAYDLYINGYARSVFSGWCFREELYRPSDGLYGSIYAIEVLEHLDDPYAFLADCTASLAVGGRLVVTTATNVPQFDHRVNFVDEHEVEHRAAMLGLSLEYRSVIPHAYQRTDIGARNDFYVFGKEP